MNKEIKRLNNLVNTLNEGKLNVTNTKLPKTTLKELQLNKMTGTKQHGTKVKQTEKIQQAPKPLAKKSKVAPFKVEIAKEGERINKLLARLGLCSRRQADELILQGKVLIDGVAATLGSKFSPNTKITLDGKPVTLQPPKAIYLALNKPRGVVCTTDRSEPDNIVDFLGLKERIFPIGRLDKDSSGLILLTNDGSIVNSILRERYGHSKEYLVEVDKELTASFVKQMENGVYILEQWTKPCKLKVLAANKFKITLTQGLNRQIRRMCEALGYQVKTLQRLRVMHITLGNLQVGEYRHLTAKEVLELKCLLSNKITTVSDKRQNKEIGADD